MPRKLSGQPSLMRRTEGLEFSLTLFDFHHSNGPGIWKYAGTAQTCNVRHCSARLPCERDPLGVLNAAPRSGAILYELERRSGCVALLDAGDLSSWCLGI